MPKNPLSSAFTCCSRSSISSRSAPAAAPSALVESETGRLLVGPRSAGASPGPVCYDAGGEQVTVTDADLALGIIYSNHFLRQKEFEQGKIPQSNRRENRPAPEIERCTNLLPAFTTSSMRNCPDPPPPGRAQSGHLPEEFVIYAFGGAGPVMSWLVVRPRNWASNRFTFLPPRRYFSAFGAAAADVIRTRNASCQAPARRTAETSLDAHPVRK